MAGYLLYCFFLVVVQLASDLLGGGGLAAEWGLGVANIPMVTCEEVLGDKSSSQGGWNDFGDN